MTSSKVLPARQGVPYESLLGFWRQPQELLTDVLRWEGHANIPEYPIRRQNTLQHSYAIGLLTTIFNSQIKELERQGHVGVRGFDRQLLAEAVHIHDYAEGIICAEKGCDLLAYNKNDHDDVEEYETFVKHLSSSGLPRSAQTHLIGCFLLQFGTKSEEEIAKFPFIARCTLTTIQEQHWREAVSHAAIERWDYLMYALEQYVHFGNSRILYQVGLYNYPRLDRLVRKFWPIKKIFWDDETRSWLINFLEENRDRFPDIDETGKPR